MVLYQQAKKCNGTAKLNTESNLIEPLNSHNHPLSDYKSEIFTLKSECKRAARSLCDRLSKVFKHVVRNDPAAAFVSYKNLESAMYRSRREIEPPIPQTAVEFSQMIASSQFAIHFKGKVEVGCDVGVFFFSEVMSSTLKCRRYSF